MTKRKMRGTLLQAASILVLSGGTALADGLEVGVGGDAGAGVSVGSDGSGSGGVDAGVGADAGADVAVDGGDEPHTGATAADAGVDAGADAGVDAGVAADAGARFEDNGQANAAAGADATFGAWTLAEFSGKRVSTPTGKEIGTVESVVADVSGNIHLVTAVDALAGDGQERVIPLGHFTPDSAGAGLTLTGTTEAALETMADYGSVASDYTMIESTAELRAQLATTAGVR